MTDELGNVVLAMKKCHDTFPVSISRVFEIASLIRCQRLPLPRYPTRTISNSHRLLGRCLCATSTYLHLFLHRRS